MLPLKIVSLRDEPCFRELVANWISTYWHEVISFSTAYEKLDECLTNRTSNCLIGLIDTKPIATATIFQNDMKSCPQLSPWLTDVFVIPSHRTLGLAKAMIYQAIAFLDSIEEPNCFLWTRSSDLIAYYSRLGWRIFEELDYRQSRATIMKFDVENIKVLCNDLHLPDIQVPRPNASKLS